MLYLESFTQRVKLAEIVSRWMVNQPRPGDVEQLKKIVNFNSYAARIWVDHMARDLLCGMHGQEPESFKARTKGALKDFVVKHPLYTNTRIEEIRRHYGRFPEDYYRETPFDGRVYFHHQNGGPLFVGSTRIKRFRRIAEKGGRRIVDFLFQRIRHHADDLARERALAKGISKEQLVTTQAEMEDEFRHAERRLIKSIKQRTLQSQMPVLAIPDVVGIKLIAEKDQYSRLIDLLNNNDSYRLLEEEHHRGRYNATNLRVAHMLPREQLLENAPQGIHRDVLASRGFDPDLVQEQYLDFVREGEDHVMVEVIVSTFQDFMESEYGNAMHEARVLSQRTERQYRGPLATAVRYLMDYMFTLCIAPAHGPIPDVPIKLWVKYMPDTIDRAIRDLFNVPSDSSFENNVAPQVDVRMIRRPGSNEWQTLPAGATPVGVPMPTLPGRRPRK